MPTFTVTAVFDSAGAAIAAAEKMREAVSPGHGSSEVLLPGHAPFQVEWQNTDWLKIALFGAAFGLVGTYIFLSILGGGFWYGFAGLVAGVAAGVMLGVWVSGETFATRPGLRVDGERVRDALAQGRAVVRVSVEHRKDAERAAELLETMDGYVEEPALPIRASIEEHLRPI
jgi:hypothetical protein